MGQVGLKLAWVQLLQVELWPEEKEEVVAAGLQWMKLVLSSASFASWAFLSLLVLSSLGLLPSFSTDLVALLIAELVFALDQSLTSRET